MQSAIKARPLTNTVTKRPPAKQLLAVWMTFNMINTCSIDNNGIELSFCFIVSSHVLTCAQNLDLVTAWISLNMGCCWDCRGVTAWMTAVNSWDGLLPAEIQTWMAEITSVHFGLSLFVDEFLCLIHEPHKNAVFTHCKRQSSLHEISLKQHQSPVCNNFLRLY